MRTIRRIVNIRPGEDRPVLVLALGWAFIVGFTVSGKAARDAIFLSRYDRSYLPLMVVAIAVAVAIAMAVCSRAARIANPRQLLAWMSGIAVVSVWLLHFRLSGLLIPAFYVWIEVVTAVLGLQFWLMASELIDSRQAKRLFGLVAGGGSLTAILVGSQLKRFVNAHGAAGLLPLVSGFALAAGILALIAGRMPAVPQPVARRRKELATKRKFDGYLISIATVVCAAAACSTLVDYQFKIVASREMSTETELVGFFGALSAAAGFSGLVFQFLLTGRILSRVGIMAGLALLPLGLGASSAYVLLNATLAAAAIAKFSDQSLKFTVHNSGMECLWLPVPYARRQAVKPWITGTLKSAAEGLSGLAIFFLVKAVPLRLLSLLVLAACSVWIWTLFRLRSQYSRALEQALSSRSIEYEDLQLDVQDSAAAATVERSLTSGDAAEQLFTLELIQRAPLAAWTSTLRRLLENGAPEVQRKVLEIAGDDARIIPDAVLIAAVGRDASTAEAAIRAGIRRGLTEWGDALEKRRGDSHAGVRAAAARAFYEMGRDADGSGAVLSALLNGDRGEQLAALDELAGMPALLPDGGLARFLASPFPDVQEAALRIVAERRSIESIPAVLGCLTDPETAIAARATLLQLPAEAVAEHIGRRLRGDQLTAEERMEHVRLLRHLPPDQAFPLLCDQLDRAEPPKGLLAPDSLLVICRHTSAPAEVLKRVESRGLDWAHTAYVAGESVRILPAGSAAILLRDHFEHLYLRSVSELMKLLAVRRPSVPVETCLQIIAAGDQSRISFVLDLLDSFLPLAERKRIVPLFEASPLGRGEAGRRLFDDLPSTADDVVEASIASERDWERAIGLDYRFRGEADGLHGHRPMVIGAGPLSAEVLARAIATRSIFMYSTLEKTIILKSSTLFSAIAAETLSRVAQMAEEVSAGVGASVYREGEPGSALFVVAAGAVRVNAGSVELGVLRRGESFGEVAVLNRDVYHAAATAVEDSVLLRIERDDIFDLMRSNVEIMQGIIGLLARRVLQVGDLLRDSGRRGGAEQK